MSRCGRSLGNGPQRVDSPRETRLYLPARIVYASFGSLYWAAENVVDASGPAVGRAIGVAGKEERGERGEGGMNTGEHGRPR